MSGQNVRLVWQEHIATITLDRPKANALHTPMVGELMGTMDKLAREEKLRVLMITGTGDRYFCAGADMNELGHMSVGDFDRWLEINQRLFNAIAHLPFPTIAALNGYCLGGGLELALACDLRIAKGGIQLGFPEVGLGVLPGTGGTQRLTRLTGPGIAKGLILTGRLVGAEEALRLGIVNHVVDQGEWPGAVERLAEEIASRAPIAVRLAKRCVDQASDASLAAGLAYERQANLACFATEDLREGLAAFREKREPVFRHQ
jgi:enoyl-CoA hydratase/carnithine racemase